MASEAPKMKATLGLTGLTVNAMALIAPGAFLWLTYQIQSAYGAPMAGSDIWFGILAALLLCMATAISYAELAKLYPGAGSSYFFAEQAFLSKTRAYKFARLAKFIIGWASHLYYWVYPGLMVGVTALLVGYMAGEFFPQYFNSAVASPLLMMLFCVVFAVGVGYIAYRGANASTGINLAVNIVQISALLIFSVIAIANSVYYRTAHPGQTTAFWTLDPDGVPTQYDLPKFAKDATGAVATFKTGADGKVAKFKTEMDADKPKTDEKGQYVFAKDAKGELIPDEKGQYAPDEKGVYALDPDSGAPLEIPDKPDEALPKAQQDALVKEKGEYKYFRAADENGQPAVVDAKHPFTLLKLDYMDAVTAPDKDHPDVAPTRQWFDGFWDVVRPHGISYIIIQACVAILILVGFESVTSMGEEAKNAKRDIPWAIILSLAIQGGFCYLIEYFAAGYLLYPGYPMTSAASATAPIGDMMKLSGAWLFGSAVAGQWFMRIMALTVFLALIGTTLACLNTGARVTYAMGRDDEVPSHFGLLHGKNLTPHRAIWTLVVLSIFIGILTVFFYLCGPAASPANDATMDSLKGNVWYSFGMFRSGIAGWIPNSLIVITLVSNFGTFLLYMLTCYTAIVAFREHHMFNGFKHLVIPVFGLLANLACMLFYVIGPWMVTGMSKVEPYVALGIAGLWGAYGWYYFTSSSKAKGKSLLLTSPAPLNGAAGKEAAYITN